jgi:glycosyltransferase involved in cell wall biosynthesis
MKIAWLTDAQAPYREPLWRELTAAADFEVSFVFREEKVRHWVWRDNPHYRSWVAPAWTVPLPGAVARRLDSPMAWLEPGSAGRILRGTDALIIQNWWQPANLWCAWRGRRRGVPYLLYAESTLQSRRFARGPLAWLRRLVFRNAGAVVVPGPAAGTAAIADGAPPRRVVESVNSIDLTQFDRRVRDLRDGAAAADPEHRFVYVGQLIERKNVAALVRAFAGVSAKATLDIAGDGVEMDVLRALALSLGVEERVRFHGYLEEPDIVELLSRTHTLVLPSTEEVYGFTALEGYVAGLQVIVSARAGIAANLAGRAGTWIVEPTVEGIQEALAGARDAWGGWLDDVDVDFASPRRAAADIVRAAEIART